MTIIVYEDGALYCDRALIATEAGIYTNSYSKKMVVHPERIFALGLAGDEIPPETEKAVMRLVDDLLTLIYVLGDTDPYPPSVKLGEIIQNRGVIVMTQDRAFHLKRKPGTGVAGEKPDVTVVEASLGQRFVAGNCGPFYLVERAMGTAPFVAMERAVQWKMGKQSTIDVIMAKELNPFVRLTTEEGEVS